MTLSEIDDLMRLMEPNDEWLTFKVYFSPQNKNNLHNRLLFLWCCGIAVVNVCYMPFQIIAMGKILFFSVKHDT